MGTDEQAIRDLVARWHEAAAIGDVDTILGLMADDVVFLVAGKPPMRGRTAFDQGLRALLSHHRIKSSGDVQEIEVSGNLAYCWTNLTVRVVPLQVATPRSVRVVRCRSSASGPTAPGW